MPGIIGWNSGCIYVGKYQRVCSLHCFSWWLEFGLLWRLEGGEGDVKESDTLLLSERPHLRVLYFKHFLYFTLLYFIVLF